MNDTATPDEQFFHLANRFKRAVAELMSDEFPQLAGRLAVASVRDSKAEALAWRIHDETGNRYGVVYDWMRDLPRLWDQQNVDNAELSEWVRDVEKLAQETGMQR
jgi:hypothetical protein